MTNDNKQHSTANDAAPKAPTNTKPPTEIASPSTAKEEKQQKKKRANEAQQNEVSPKGRVRIRLLPVWLRVILVLCLLVLVTVVGLVFGYSVLGDGNAADALKWDTWQHILDIMRGVE